MGDLFFWFSFFICVAGTGLDFYSSLGFQYWGMREGTKFLRDKNGFFSEKRYLLLAAAGCVIPFVIYFLDRDYGWAIGFVFIVIGAVRGFVGYRNLEKRKRARERQTAVLRKAQTDAPLDLTVYRYKGKRYFANLFGAFYSDEQNYETAYSQIEAKVRALAAEPETNWFTPAVQDKIQREVK